MGNSEGCAYEIGADLKKRNIDNEVLGMASFNHDQLVDDGLLVVVVSTTGHGNPPHNATALYNHLKFEKPELKGRRFAVMALGSRRYQKFAECGKEFDQMLGALGGTRVMDRIDCDGDYDIDDAIAAMADFDLGQDDCPADVDGDGSIGFSDVLIILNDWGACP